MAKTGRFQMRIDPGLKDWFEEYCARKQLDMSKEIEAYLLRMKKREERREPQPP